MANPLPVPMAAPSISTGDAVGASAAPKARSIASLFPGNGGGDDDGDDDDIDTCAGFASASPPSSQSAQPTSSSPAARDSLATEADESKIGDEIWVPDSSSDGGQVWVRATLVSKHPTENDAGGEGVQRGLSVTVRHLDGSEEVVCIDAGAALSLVNPSVEADVTSLHHLHEAAILHNLHERSCGGSDPHQQCSPYTFMASALLAVNPLRPTPLPPLSAYVDQPITSAPPHPFSISELAFKNLAFSRTSQSIVIGGESGSGKTETAKIVLRYLVERKAAVASAADSGRGGAFLDAEGAGAGGWASKSDLEQRLLRSSPVLESFGNAKTSRNNNSSRFGKFLKLTFTLPPDSTAAGPGLTRRPFASPAPDGGAGGRSGGGVQEQQQGPRLTGARIETYLLEKSRVTRQGDGECNFHILYLLVQACPPDLGLNAPGIDGNFNILGGGDTSLGRNRRLSTTAHGWKASNMSEPGLTLDSIGEALKAAGGLTTAQVHGVWRVLAGVLHLGNVTFEEHSTQDGEVARLSSAVDPSSGSKASKAQQSLSLAAAAWGVEARALQKAVMERTVTTRGESYAVPFTVREAAFARDAVCKGVYEALFAHIVALVNRSLRGRRSGSESGREQGSHDDGQCDHDDDDDDDDDDYEHSDGATQQFIGVLDIFGFENFDHNDFEQLLINYANEALQNTFNQQLFEKELELFRAEHIDFTVSSCPNNARCVELLAGRGASSIFNTLDAVSRQPKPSDERFCEELHKAFGGGGGQDQQLSSYFPPVHRKDMRAKFQVRHYAGVVEYTVAAQRPKSGTALDAGGLERRSSRRLLAADVELAEGSTWISKNTDQVPDELVELYYLSTLPEFQVLAAGAPRPSAMKNARRRSVMLKPTTSATFSRSMDVLNALLCSTTCQFVRCIKPNARMEAGVFDAAYVVQQVRSLGVLQACEVLKVSLPTRISYQQLRTSMAAVVDQVLHLFEAAGEGGAEEVVLVACLLQALDISEDLYRLGRTMVFFRPGQLARLDGLLRAAACASPEQVASWVQRVQEIHSSNLRAQQLAAGAKAQLEELQAAFALLEEQFDRASERAEAVPEVRELELPEELLGDISQVKGLTTAAQERYNAVNLQLVTAHAQLLSLDEDDDDANDGKDGDAANGAKRRILDPAVRAQLETQHAACEAALRAVAEAVDAASAQDEQLSSMVEALEDACGGPSQLFRDTLEQCEAAYEQLQSELNALAESAIRAQEEAERCQLPRVEARVRRCAELEAAIRDIMHAMRDDMLTLDQEYASYQAAGEGVDFGPVLAQGRELVRSLRTCQDQTVPTAAAAVHQFSEAVHAALTAPIPAPAAPTASPNTAAGAGGGKGVPKRLNYSIKDLAAMRRQKQLQQNGSAGSTVPPPSTAAAPVIPPAAVPSNESPSQQTGSTAAPEGPPPLPAGWRQATDRRTGRSYYVNQMTKERQWRRPIDPATASSPPAAVARTPPGNVAALQPQPHRDVAPTNNVRFEGDDSASGSTAAASTMALPDGWKEAVDKKTGRTYYVHMETKERQWRHPRHGSRRASALGAEDAFDLSSGGGSGGGADGTGEETEAQRRLRLSKRMILKDFHALLAQEGLDPAAAQQLTFGAGVGAAGDGAAGGQLGIAGAAWNGEGAGGWGITADGLTGKMADVVTGAAVGAAAAAGYFHPGVVRERRVARARALAAAVLSAPQLPDELATGRSVALLVRLGNQTKRGYLAKKGKTFGRWLKRFYQLSDGNLESYDRESDAASGRHAKAFFLTGSCITTYTTTKNCISISDPADGDPEKSSLYVLASSEREMESWMSAINGHIHMCYVNEWRVSSDQWDEGEVGLSFWMVPDAAITGTERRPVGVRTLPNPNAPRTGEGLYPGEIVEVVQTIEIAPTATSMGQRFLRLAGDRGWVFENHPTGKYTVLMEVPGELKEEPLYFRYSEECLEDLQVYSSPCCRTSRDGAHTHVHARGSGSGKTGQAFRPGSVLFACAQWTTTCAAAFPPGGGGAVAEDGSEATTFVKLVEDDADLFAMGASRPEAGAAERGSEGGAETAGVLGVSRGNTGGWVPMYHPITAGQLLFPLSRDEALAIYHGQCNA